MTPYLPAVSMEVLRAASTASEPELQKIVLAVWIFWSWVSVFEIFSSELQRSKVMRLSSRASSALRAWGWTSPMACRRRSIWSWPALTTWGLAWPAAATPKAAVRSRYFLPSASQTFTPLARSQTIGQEPSDSVKSTLRDSYSRRRSSVSRVFMKNHSVPITLSLRFPSPRPSPPGRGRNFIVIAERSMPRNSIQRGRFISLFNLDAALLGGPDDFVQLRLETHGQGVGDDVFDELQTGNRGLAGRD